MKSGALTHFIFAVLFALTALAGYVLWFVSFSGAQARAQHAATEVIRIEQEDIAISDARDTLESLTADEELLASYFVSAEGIVPFLEELERLGDVFQSEVEVASVANVPSGGRMALSVRISGSFASVMKTLGTIEYGAWDMRTTSLTLDTAPGETEEVVWVAAVVFSVATSKETP